MRRECWGTDIITIHLERNRGSNTSMSTSLVERNCGTAPHPLYWKYNESLLIPIPQILGCLLCEGDYCIPLSIAKKYNVFFFIYQDTFEGSYSYDTPSDWLLYHPQQALLVHLITFLVSYCSVIFILTTPTGKSISKILTLYTTIYEEKAI